MWYKLKTIKGCNMLLKKALTTTALATVLLTSSISANELTSIKAFDNIPTANLNSTELNLAGENWEWVDNAWDDVQSWYSNWRESSRQIQNQRNQNFQDGNDWNIYDSGLTGNSYNYYGY
jgi:hypothetical protein